MSKRAILIDWDGRRVPDALKRIPPGRYRLERLEDVPPLTAAEDAGLRAALDQLDAGQGRSLSAVIASLRRRAKRV